MSSTVNPDEVALTPDEPAARYRFIMTTLRGRHRDRGYVLDRAFSAGGRLLGYGHGDLRYKLRLSERFSNIEDWFEHTAWMMPGRLNVMPPCIPTADKGDVYLARLTDYPHIVKVGISVDLDRRMKQLTRQTGCHHEVESYRAGCYFDEAVQFIRRLPHNIWSEWFIDPSFGSSDLPEFLARGHAQHLWSSAIGALTTVGSAPYGASTPNALELVYSRMLREAVPS
jgi:hypothetical protein